MKGWPSTFLNRSSQFLFSSVWHMNTRLFTRSSANTNQKNAKQSSAFSHIVSFKKEDWDGGLCLSTAEMVEITDGHIETLWFLFLLQQGESWVGGFGLHDLWDPFWLLAFHDSMIWWILNCRTWGRIYQIFFCFVLSWFFFETQGHISRRVLGLFIHKYLMTALILFWLSFILLPHFYNSSHAVANHLFINFF